MNFDFSLTVSAKTESPVSITDGRTSSSQIETLDYIPGTTWRGALASDFIKRFHIEAALKNPSAPTEEQKKALALFNRLFVSDEVSFGNLYPRRGHLAQPFPRTARSCKFHNGFGKSHGVHDILIPSVQFKLTGHFDAESDVCACGAPLEPITGYYFANLGINLQQEVYASGKTRSEVSRRSLAHTAIHPATETNLSGALYAIDALQEGQYFEGEAWFVDQTLGDEFANLIDARACYIGADKTRGLGKVELTKCVCSARQIVKQEIQERWRFFNQEIAYRLGESVDVTRFFCVTLLSDGVATDDYLRYQSVIRPEDFAEAAQTSGAGEAVRQYELFLSFTAKRLISGWNVAPAARLPKEDDLAIEKGAVFVYRRKDEVTAGQAKIDEMLRLLEGVTRNGIGLRRNEGFGRVTVCDYFHCLREAI